MTSERSSLSLHRVLSIDAAGCAALGVAGSSAAAPLADALGLASATPVRVTAIAFLVYAIEMAVLRGRATRRHVAALVVTDVGFGLALLAFVLIDPTGAQPWARWAGVALADASLAFGVLKVWALRRAPQADVRDTRSPAVTG